MVDRIKKFYSGYLQPLRQCIPFLVVYLLLIACASEPKQQGADSTEPRVFAPHGEFEQFMEELLAKDAFSGVVLIAKDGETLFEKAYGMANIAENIPNTVDTLFDVASIGKVFTAIAILQFAEQGKVSLDDTIDTYVKGFPPEIGSKVTIEQLLLHTSGMGDFMGPEYHNNSDTVISVSDIMRIIVNQPLHFAPGTRHLYSNAGYVTLGAIIEVITGQDYFTYITEHITKPAGMSATGFHKKNSNLPLAHGYIPRGERFEDTTERQPLKGNPSGGIYATAPDLLRFSSALVSFQILNKESTELAVTGKTDTPVGRYGYGFEEIYTNGIKTIGHSGGSPGINACFRIVPDKGYIIIILSNYDNGIRLPYEEIIKLVLK